MIDRIDTSNPAAGSQKGEDLAQRTLCGIFWTFSGTGVRVVLETVVLVVLARLLAPMEFGIVTAAITVIRFSEIVAYCGVEPAIVQRPAIEARHLQTGFTFSCITGITMACLVYLLAPQIAGFLRIVELGSILPILALIFPIRSISLVAESLLQREVKFRILARIDVLSYSLGYGIVGVSLAFTGFGVWSLVAANLSQAVLKTILLLRSQPHPKRMRIEPKAFKELIYFGGGFIAGRICNSLAGQGDYLVVARWLGAASLGVYQRAYQLMAMPANFFGMALDKVLFPVMAKLQNNPSQLKKAYRAGVMLIALLVLPISAIMYHLAAEIISVLLGDQWLEVVVPFRILALGMLFRTSYKMSDSLARATGSVYRRAWRQGIYAALVFCGAWVGQFWGVAGVAYGIFWAIFVNFLLMAQLSLKITSMTWREFISAHMPASILALIVWFVISGSASMLRHVEMSKMSIIAIPLLGVLITLFLLFRYMPKRILGEEAIHICSQLASRATSNLNFLKISRDRHTGSEGLANVK